jgi:hypothetical protein
MPASVAYYKRGSDLIASQNAFFVQFPHPGGEHKPSGRNAMERSL